MEVRPDRRAHRSSAAETRPIRGDPGATTELATSLGIVAWITRKPEIPR